MGFAECSKKYLRMIGDRAGEILFPRKCLGCGAFGDWFCPACALTLSAKTGHRCPECHCPSAYGAYCRRCRPNMHLDGLLIAADYKDRNIAALIKAYKYRGLPELGWLLSELTADHYRSLLDDGSGDLDPEWAEIARKQFPAPAIFDPGPKTVIPVPLHPRRRRWRGFDQSEYLADSLIRRFPEFRTPAGRLFRRFYQKPQAKLDRLRRKKNLAGAFAWTGPRLETDPVLLIDDVASTGTTLNECARVLKQEAGAISVWGLVVAQNT